MSAIVVSLDGRAIKHLESELAATNQLGRIVLPSVQLERGSVKVVVPEPHAPHIYDFRRAIVTRSRVPSKAVPGGHIEPVPSTEHDVSRWIRRLLVSDARRVLVCESYLLRSKDLKRVSSLPRRTVSSGNFVYHWSAHDDSEQQVAAVVSMIYPVPLGFAVLGTLPVDSVEMLGTGAIDPSILAALAQRADCIILGVYDGESVLVWTREGAPFDLSDADLA